MWLINSTTLELEGFHGKAIPPYAILSHRWGSTESEVSFEEYNKNSKVNTAGCLKIRDFCKIACEHGLQWAWVDTCCIDKKSSAELSESINSMFAWYSSAQTCYVYLSDIDKSERLQDSEWWGRGWTLQELIAPTDVIFYDKHWQKIGTKLVLATQIERVTGVPSAVLKHEKACIHWSVAQRLSWAAGRSTTREEDRAYSLLGLFQINMALLYGEGSKAFRRLQLEILQKYPDESIFAWRIEDTSPHPVLAANPDHFRHSSKMAPANGRYGSSSLPLDPDPRRFNPARVTSWSIELRANARKLSPLQPVRVRGKEQKFLWALTLSIASNGKIKELPCTIVLVQSGPAPYSYRLFQSFHCSPRKALTHLEADHNIGQLEQDKIFYLQFDDDLDASDSFNERRAAGNGKLSGRR